MKKLITRTVAICAAATLTVSAAAGANMIKQLNTEQATVKAAQSPILLAHYDFDNITGTEVKDVTGNGYDGTLDGTDIKIENEYITVNEKNDSDYGSGLSLKKNPFADTDDDVTISAWVKASTSPDENSKRTFMNVNTGTASNRASYMVWMTKFESGGGLRYVSSGSIQTGSRLKQNEWNLISVVQKGEKNTLYLNGTAVGVCNSAKTLKEYSEASVTFGKGITWPDKGFKGSIDDIKIYKGAISDIQLMQEYQKKLYPISGFSVDGYYASVDQQSKQMYLSLPQGFKLDSAAPIITTAATEITLNGTPFKAGDTVTLNSGDNTIAYKTADSSGSYTLKIYSEQTAPLAQFKFTADNIDESGNITDNGYTAKVTDSAQVKSDYVNLNGGYIDIDPDLIADTGAALTLSFTISRDNDSALKHTLLSVGADADANLNLYTDYRTDCEGPQWSLKTRSSDRNDVRSDEFVGFGRWTNLTFTQVNSEVKIYIDGRLSSQGTSMLPASLLGKSTAYLGRAINDSDRSPLNGQIADFSVYKGAMSDDEVNAMFNSLTFPGTYEIDEPDDASCDLIDFAYPGKQCTIDIEDDEIHVKTDLFDPLGDPVVEVSDTASYEIKNDKLLITAANGIDQTVYKLNIEYPKSPLAELESVTVNGIAAVIDEKANTVSVDLPAGSDAATADIRATAKENGTTAVNGDQIIVTSENGLVTKEYALVITVKKYAIAQLIEVTVNGKSALINENAKTVSIVLPYGERISNVNAACAYNGTAVVAGDYKSVTVTAEDKATTSVYSLQITNAPAPKPTKPVYKDKIVGSIAYDKDGNAVTGTKTIKIANVTYAVKNGIVQTGTKVIRLNKSYYALVKGKVQSGTKVVKAGKTYYAVKSGKVVYLKKSALIKIGKKKFAVSKKGVVKLKQRVKIGKHYYVNKSKTAGIYKNVKFKLKGKKYSADKKGIVNKTK